MAKTKPPMFVPMWSRLHPLARSVQRECKEWNTITEVRLGSRRPARAPATQVMPVPSAARVQTLAEIATTGSPFQLRLLGELDRVLGGGVVPGSAILIGGNPGGGQVGPAAADHVWPTSAAVEGLPLRDRGGVLQQGQRAGPAGWACPPIGCACCRDQRRADLPHRPAGAAPRIMVIGSIQVMRVADVQSAGLRLPGARSAACSPATPSRTMWPSSWWATSPRLAPWPATQGAGHCIDCSRAAGRGHDSRFRTLRSPQEPLRGGQRARRVRHDGAGDEEVSNPLPSSSAGAGAGPGSIVW